MKYLVPWGLPKIENIRQSNNLDELLDYLETISNRHGADIEGYARQEEKLYYNDAIKLCKDKIREMFQHQK